MDSSTSHQITERTGLDPETSSRLEKIFGSPVCSESIFVLRTSLNSGSSDDVNSIFELFIKKLDSLNSLKMTHSPELLASAGIYFSIILRYGPNTELYVAGKHFLIIALEFYLPYMTMYITLFLIIAVIRRTDIHVNKNMKNLTMSNETLSTLQNIKKMNPKNSDLFEVRLKERVGTAERYRDSGSDDTDETVIGFIISKCPHGSPERKILTDLRRVYDSRPIYILTRMGLKNQKLEMAMFLDDIDLLEEELTEDDIQKAIFLHSNSVLKTSVQKFKPHHFDRSIQCLNYEITKLTSCISDWINKSTLDEFILACKELKHSLCLEMLLMIIAKNMTLCKHHLKRIPQTWVSDVMEIYTTPRWKQLKEDCATLEYYRANMCSNENYEKFVTFLAVLSEKLKDADAYKQFIESVKAMNKSHYIFQMSGYSDFLSDTTITFSNTEDSMLNDVFEISRNFIIPYRENNKIYLFDFNLFSTLLEKRQNPYNRNRLSDEVIKTITNKFQYFNSLGLSRECVTISEFVDELIGGRSVQTCSCVKNYRLKLVRIVRNYGVKDDHIDYINISDIVFKLSMISIDLQAESIDELCKKLYRLIKLTDDDRKESLIRTIASIILVYNRDSGNYMIL